jgi:MOSC domain-containing protein YiiM/8-oxo-dGTP pyrophosphatase MutT (NUDIX family)
VRPTLPGLLRRQWAVGRIVGGRSGESGDRQEHDGRVVIGQESIGVGVIVVRGGAVLLGMRRDAHGASSWSFPGGHLDGDESIKTCAIRELREEAGIEMINAYVVAETADDLGVGFRYRTLFVQGDWAGGEPTVGAPDKCAEWGWFCWDDPPQPLFPPVASLWATGFRPAANTVPAGVVAAIHVAATAGQPMRPVEFVRATAGVGLEGDRYALGRGHYSPDLRVSRDLTLIEAEVIEELARDYGIELAPGETRRNLTTRGVRLNDLVGRRFWVGDVLCEGTRLCEPCHYLTELTGKPLLLRALVHRGGLRADIIRGGRICRGDQLQLVAGEVGLAGGTASDRGAERV